MSALITTTAAVGASGLAVAGAWLVYTGVQPRPVPSGPVPGQSNSRVGRDKSGRRPSAAEARAGLGRIGFASVAVGLAGGAFAYLIFGAVAPSLVAALFAATFPAAADRRRVQTRREAAVEAWPRMLEEIRLRTGSLGRSIPQALFEAGHGAPEDWRPAFEAAEREWLLTVDFLRTLEMLKDWLADPTADAVCETLLVAQETGGGDLDARLVELIEDRTQDVQCRRDAASRLAGVRFARRFVLLVPLGMAGAGLTIGSGRQAYATTGGQIAVMAGLAAVAGCWWWSGRLMRLPASRRVFR